MIYMGVPEKCGKQDIEEEDVGTSSFLLVQIEVAEEEVSGERWAIPPLKGAGGCFLDGAECQVQNAGIWSGAESRKFLQILQILYMKVCYFLFSALGHPKNYTG